MSYRDRRDQDRQVLGQTIELAALVKAKLEELPDGGLVKTEWGSFYVSGVELSCYSSGETEPVGYLVPDEAEGSTYDFYTPLGRTDPA